MQANLNQTIVPSLGNRAPIELFTGLPCPSPLDTIFVPSLEKEGVVPVRDTEKIKKAVNELRMSIMGMHKVVEDARLKQTLLNQKKARGENIVNFSIGDYVLRSRVDEST